MPRSIAVHTDEHGQPVVVVVCEPAELGMVAKRVDEGPHVQIARVAEYPPLAGQWWRHETGGFIEIGCPRCAKPSGIRCAPHQVHLDGRIEPLWVCPHKCGLEDVLQLAGFEPQFQGACPSCAHVGHGQPCAEERSGEPCGCLDDGDEHRPVYKLERSVKGRILLPSELQREAKRIVSETMHRARS